MSYTDTKGREWARISELKGGSFITVDSGFSCIEAGSICEVTQSDDGLWIPCSHGHHYLSGQLETDNDHLIGIYPA